MSSVNSISHKKNFDPYKSLGIPFTILIVILSVLLLQSIAKVRIKELSVSLENIDRINGTGRSLGLIARYQLIKKRYSKKEETAQDYLSEGELIAVLSGDFSKQELNTQSLQWTDLPAIWVINTVSFAFGIEGVQEITPSRNDKLLEIAYFYERKRDFKKAITIYDTTLKVIGNSPRKLAYVYLHRGFCASLSGDREIALENYKQVMNLVPEEEMALTAEFLSIILRELNSKIDNIDKMALSISKGQEYYKYMAYHQAIETFNQMHGKLSQRNQQLFFYRGRSYEEIGQITKALDDYRAVIKLNPKSSMAKNANRRIYLLGAYYENNSELKLESQQNAIRQDDVSFLVKSRIIEKAVNKNNISRLKDDEYTTNAATYVEKNTELKISDDFQFKPNALENATNKNVALGPSVFRLPVTPEIVKETSITVKEVQKEEATHKEETPVSDWRNKDIGDIDLTPEQRRELIKLRHKKVDKLFTKDGQVFVGAIRETSDDKIKMVTVLGLITVDQDKVVMRLKVDSDKALK